MTSPFAIEHLYDRLKAEGYPDAEFGGIYAKKPGYHNARKNLTPSDYSVQEPDDKLGSSDNASALDITLRNSSDMKKITQRLIDLTNAEDGRVQVLREFYGTVDGYNVTGREVRTKRVISSDDSHLWHLHISVYRKWSGDSTAMNKVADAILGKGNDSGSEGANAPADSSEGETTMFIVTKANGAAYLLWGDDMMYAIENGDDMAALKNLKENVPRGIPYSAPVSDDLFNRMTKGRSKK